VGDGWVMVGWMFSVPSGKAAVSLCACIVGCVSERYDCARSHSEFHTALQLEQG